MPAAPVAWPLHSEGENKEADKEVPVNQTTTDTSPFVQVPAFRLRLPAVPPLTRSERLDLLRGMLSRLVDATPAGQHHLMRKVLPLLRREALDPSARFQPNHRALIMRSLDELEHEAACVAPDPEVFDRKAEVLVDVFALV
jgi:hypothetical protein